MWLFVCYPGTRRAPIHMPHTIRTGSKRKYMYCYDVKQHVRSERWMEMCMTTFASVAKISASEHPHYNSPSNVHFIVYCLKLTMV